MVQCENEYGSYGDVSKHPTDMQYMVHLIDMAREALGEVRLAACRLLLAAGRLPLAACRLPLAACCLLLRKANLPAFLALIRNLLNRMSSSSRLTAATRYVPNTCSMLSASYIHAGD